MSQEKTGAEGVRWNLSFLYQGLDDPQIEVDLATWSAKAKAFHETYKGKLHEMLGAAIADYAGLKMLSDKLMMYPHLLLKCDTGDAKAQTKAQEIGKVISRETGEWLVFFEHEIVGLDDKAILAQADDPIVSKHLPWLKQLRAFKEHLLSEAVESALIKRDPFGPSSWAEFFDEMMADLRFPWEGEEKTLEEILHLQQMSKDPDVRAAALKVTNDGLGGFFSKYSAQTLYMTVGSKEVEDRERRFRHPMECRNKASLVPDQVVDALHTSVVDYGGPLARRYYKLKADQLGMSTLKWSDRNAPMPFASTTPVTWDDALSTVLKAYESFSPTLANLIQGMIAEGWIDAAASKGKAGGAFNNSFCVPGDVPVAITFMNYLGSARDVMTLAHELGHGVHGMLAGRAQGSLMIHPPIPYAETASIFGEMTTFTFLKEKIVRSGDKKELLALLMHKLDMVMNTVIRQIGFSNFERRVHGARKRLSVEELDAIWMETTYELYGKPGDVFTYEDTNRLWAFIPHFHWPFYVFGYAFGELLTQSLYAMRGSFGNRFEELYLELLRAGGTKDVVELLAPFKLNAADPAFWVKGMQVGMKSMLDEAEILAKELEKVA